MAVSYSGDKGGVRKSLYVIGVNGDFKGVLKTTGSTTDYLNAGGVGFTAASQLDPFKSATLFQSFAKHNRFSSANLSKFDSQFAQKASKSVFASAAITGDNKSFSFIPDPRATHRVVLNNRSGSTPFASSISGISHMDEIVFTEGNSGKTLQAFFMGFAKGVTLGTTQDFLVGYVGTTANAGLTAFSGFTGAKNNNLVAKNVKSGGTAGVGFIHTILDFRDVGDLVVDEAKSSLFGGESFGVTFGPSTGALRTAVVPRDFSYNNGIVKETLQNLVIRRDVLARNHACFTGDARFQKQIFVRTIHDKAKLPFTDFSYSGGITIDGVSGGTNGTSELDHLIAAYDEKIRSDQATATSTLRQFGSIFTIREVVNTSF